MNLLAAAGLTVLILLGGSGCAANPATTKPDSNPAATSSGAPLRGTIMVFAASSLGKTFALLAAKFEAAHPGVTVANNFAGSADLVAQINAGAPADVFAPADTKTMAKVSALVGKPAIFATNTLQIAVQPGNPAHVMNLADLSRAGIKTVICAPSVPCGSAAATVAKAAGVKLTPVSEENAVTDVLGKVSSGEADAGLVYLTDVRGAGTKVLGVSFPEAVAAVNAYPIASLTASKNLALARAFVVYITGPVGRSALAAAGFGAP